MPAVRPDVDEIRTAEVIACLCLATDLGMGLPIEHGLQSTVFAMRLADRLDLDAAAKSQTFYGCLLFYAGCTVDAETNAELFGDRLLTHFTPVMFGSQRQIMAGILRALGRPDSAPPFRAVGALARLPSAASSHRQHIVALCEVAHMLSKRLGLPPDVQALFPGFTERWDGKGEPQGIRGEQIPLPLRIIHVARDAAFQRMVGGLEHASATTRARAGGAFDPDVAQALADDAAEILALDEHQSVWSDVLASEPPPQLKLRDETIDEALGAVADFADLASRYFVGHSRAVADLAGAAAERCGFTAEEVRMTRRAGLVHDVGRVATSLLTWHKEGALSPDEWEQVRLHPYHTERVLSRSAALARVAQVAAFHHERMDGSGYHRGAAAAALTPPARLLAAADAYVAMTEPRPHRPAMTADVVATVLGDEAHARRLDAESVGAVLAAAGHRSTRLERPAGLTEREGEVIGLLARGLQTKQIATVLGISAKTADRHIQNIYGKVGVSTRAAATLFAMENGLVAWGELPMGAPLPRS